VIERHLDLVLGLVELVEGAIPGVELTRMDADPAAFVPVWDEATALAIADEVGFEATSTKARSANGTVLARPRCWSKMSQRPS
jgi:hypothetical protein